MAKTTVKLELSSTKVVRRQAVRLTDRHADLGYARFFANWAYRKEVDWDAMDLTWWKEKKEERQAEFLVHDWFPWSCVDMIGVYNDAMAERAAKAIAKAKHQPPIVVERGWYY